MSRDRDQAYLKAGVSVVCLLDATRAMLLADPFFWCAAGAALWCAYWVRT